MKALMQLLLTPFPKLLLIEPSGIMVKDRMMNIAIEQRVVFVL